MAVPVQYSGSDVSYLVFLSHFEDHVTPFFPCVPHTGYRKSFSVQPVEMRSFPSVGEAAAHISAIYVAGKGRGVPGADMTTLCGQVFSKEI